MAEAFNYTTLREKEWFGKQKETNTKSGLQVLINQNKMPPPKRLLVLRFE